jgi:transcriptional antiterminator RfaH
MAYWCCAQLGMHREALALHTLRLAGYATYFPRILTKRRATTGPRKLIEVVMPLFPSYAFLLLQLQWHTSRWSPGAIRLVLDGEHPAHLPDTVIADLHTREDEHGFVRLLKPKPTGFQRSDQVRVIDGVFADQLAIYEGMKPHDRILVLMQWLGAERQFELAKSAIRPVN